MHVQAEGAPANVASDLDAAVAEIARLLEEARAAAGLPAGSLDAAPGWAGLAGAIDAETCARVARALPLSRVTVSDDRPTTMAGALGGRDGCLVAAGTGSFLGRQSDGKRRFAGGWGLVLSDRASGAWLGREALAAALDARDGLRRTTPLLTALLAERGGPSAVALFSLRATPADFARLAPRVVEAAGQGDGAAKALMRAGAAWIAEGLQALGWQEGEPICLTGGVGPSYADWLPHEFARSVVPARGNPLDGAIRLACEAAGWA